MKKILIDSHVKHATIHQLEALPGVRVEAVEHNELPRQLPAELIRDCHILMCLFPPSNHADMRSLELLQLISVGYSQLYGLDLAERGVRVCNARGIFETTIAEWNLAMMDNLARDLRSMIRNQDHGHWEKAKRFANELRGRVVGLWGYGGIGRETARLAKAFGMTVHVHTRRPVGPRRGVYTVPGAGDPEGTLPDRVFAPGQTTEFLSGLDFLVLAMPLTPSNAGLIGEKELHALKSTSYVLNPARGPLIQEPALLKALREGWIAGAALDTHYYYPMPGDHPLWRFPNVIMTPHISGSEYGPYFLDRMGEILVHNVKQFLEGKPLLNELAPEELKGG